MHSETMDHKAVLGVQGWVIVLFSYGVRVGPDSVNGWLHAELSPLIKVETPGMEEVVLGVAPCAPGMPGIPGQEPSRSGTVAKGLAAGGFVTAAKKLFPFESQ
jgi:hypothetical protein